MVARTLFILFLLHVCGQRNQKAPNLKIQCMYAEGHGWGCRFKDAPPVLQPLYTLLLNGCHCTKILSC